ncbi:Hypothetical predicted protein [Cloeon dipterum]|uniref:GPI ethanolamine phosphate transferase 2 C-terminal domain-containing protein n=2 Tax=Cloeon dipterum TaxID=197152 RepID=A0A8S1D5K1_9INSE|nr:Hypothetical predicted protein [Cloeon dipterum]
MESVPSTIGHFRAHLLAVSGILIFLAGFICVERGLEVPHSQPNTPSIQVSLPPRRLVLMVVDALREDFLDRQQDWPFLSGELASNRACRVPLVADSPTVTLPRLKALVTGRVSSFVDVILNLGSPELHEENLVSLLAGEGRHSVLLGDDTWLKMLPNKFLRSKGTHSFYVNDFTEVDTNVTRELPGELAADDWSLLILHFLGLDHIGHVEGPRSRLVGPKLLEMDNVIRQIRKSLPDALLVVTGDHGMAEAGGHGGSSAQERSVALVVLGTPCLPLFPDDRWAQVDLAPTLAALLGVRGPAQAAGALIPALLAPLSSADTLEALRNNTRRLVRLAPGQNQENELLDAEYLRRQWLRGHGSWKAAAEMFTKSAVTARNVLASRHAPFDLYAMALGVIVAFTGTLWTLVTAITNKSHSCSIWSAIVAASSLLGIHSVGCGLWFGRSLACGSSTPALALQTVVSLGVAALAVETVVVVRKQQMGPKLSLSDIPIFSTAIIHTLSLGSSFCVEEEHLVWFVLLPVVLATAALRKPHRWPVLLVLFLCHLPLTRFNSTGDKWASAYDFEDWLAGKPITTSLFLGLSLATLPFLVGRGKFVVSALAVIIYLQKAASGSVLAPFISGILSERGVVEARLFYLISLAWLIHQLNQRRTSRAAALRDWWLLAACLVHRPHDVASLSFLSAACRLVLACLGGSSALAGVAASCLGWAAFFHQGNSNQLTTVAVAAGYTGLTDYWPPLVALQIILRTYAGPVLAALELAASLNGHSRTAVLAWSGQRLMAATFYLLVAAWLREHLFVWSVFAPKLLYEASHSALFTLLLPLIA